MCGIYGITENNRQFIEKYIDICSHRGPDGRSIYNDDSVTLGHNLLSITDNPKVSQQPWKTPAGNILVYNGEIFNYFELLERRAETPEDKALALSNCAYCHELLNDINAAVVALRKSIKHVPTQDAITKLDALKELNSRRALRTCMQGIFSKSVLPRTEEAVVQDLDSSKANDNGYKA